MVLSPQSFSKIFGNIEKTLYLCSHVEVTIIINILKLLQLCRNLLFQLKKKLLVVMLFRLISLILSMVLEVILNEFLRWVLLLLWIQLKKRIILLKFNLNLNLNVIKEIMYFNFKVMKKNNIWKIVIGAVSAALGYILNAIGL